MGNRSFFGPSKEAIWRQLAGEVGGQYVEGSFLKGDKVIATHGGWTFTLDVYVVSAGNTVIPFTRMRAPYVNPDGFRFEIHRRGFFTGLGKLLGMRDVEIGVPQFDEDFVIKGTDEAKLRVFFGDADVRRLIEAQPDIHLSVKDDEGWFGTEFPEGVDELYFSVAGIVTDVERLKLVYELFAATLDHLCRIGSAYATPPGVQVR
jgi:hypothetical protein